MSLNLTKMLILSVCYSAITVSRGLQFHFWENLRSFIRGCVIPTVRLYTHNNDTDHFICFNLKFCVILWPFKFVMKTLIFPPLYCRCSALHVNLMTLVSPSLSRFMPCWVFEAFLILCFSLRRAAAPPSLSKH